MSVVPSTRERRSSVSVIRTAVRGDTPRLSGRPYRPATTRSRSDARQHAAGRGGGVVVPGEAFSQVHRSATTGIDVEVDFVDDGPHDQNAAAVLHVGRRIPLGNRGEAEPLVDDF